MRIFFFFDLEKMLFLSYLTFTSRKEAELWYVTLVRAVNVPFGGFYFSNPLLPFTARKYGFWLIFLCFEFVPGITPFQIELGR